MHYELVNVIKMSEENCTNCHQCIAVCPIKYCNNGSGDTVKIDQNLCIGCGHCVEACIASHNGDESKAARHYIDDTAAMLASLPSRQLIALVAPSAQSNFDLPRLITALKKLGFSAVYDVALGAEITVACYRQLLEKQLLTPPLIAQPCPAIVKYIELNHPSLIPHLAPIGSPVHNIAVYAKARHPEAKIAFISPCLAKSREFSDSGLIDYNVTFKSMDGILSQQHIRLEDLAPADFDNVVSAGITASFSSPGGLKEAYLHHYPISPRFITRVSGQMVYDKYLADLETAIKNQSPHLPLIVDVLNCENGCNMGPGCINHHRSIDEVEIAIAMRAEKNLRNKTEDQLTDFLTNLDLDSFRYDHYRDLSGNQNIKLPTDDDLKDIYAAMLKKEDKDFRNCGACGYNSCARMAVAIYNGLNKAQNCHLYQEKALRNDQERFQTISREIARAFTEVQGSVTELSSNAGVTLNNFTEVISNIGSFRNISAEMADKAENLTPIVQTISSITKMLQEQLHFLQQMIDTIPTPIFFRDTDGVFQGCNKAFEEAVGSPRSSIFGQHLDQVLPRDLAAKSREMDRKLMDSADTQYYEGEFPYADGVRHNVIVNQAPFFNMEDELLGVVGVTVDITEHKRMEQEVLRLDRLRVVGEMAAGIAHEIRNPMTTVRGFLQIMMDQPDLAGYLDYLDMMIQEIDSANGIIGEFLSLAKDKAVNLKPQNLNHIIEALAPLLNAQALKQDKWVNISTGDIPDLLLDAQQIRQLILNLGRNGLEAMDEGGVLTISTYCTSQDVVMVIADQGPGIDAQTLTKLGTPFFTTKEQGTGLGLAVCYSIATRHNASIEVETGNDGTAFIIRFRFHPESAELM